MSGHKPRAYALLAALLTATLATLPSSCSIASRPYPTIRTFSLEIPTTGTAAAGALKKPRYTLLVTASPPPAAYESKKLVYKLSATEYAQDFYTEFYTTPARAVADSFARFLDLASPALNFVRTQGVKLPDYAMEIQLMDFYGDLTGEDPEARITMSVTLNDLRPATPMLVFTKNYSKSLPARPTGDEPREDALVEAFVVGLLGILEDLDSDLRSVINVGR
ncbi:MAG: hypothetical protein LBF41_10610 [Deltaproteobacteria bacterium]|jgi:ABC-type uncharacterized transport system auxiliary subunit|nr:hypothetical protein [Deltaproteobacteria bacterium]